MSNYTKGTYYERKTVKLLRKQGYHAQRTAGSHGLFDVVAVGHGQVRLINIKAGYWPPPKERKAFYGLDISRMVVVVPDPNDYFETPYATVPAKQPVTLEIWRWDKGNPEPIIRYEND